jgi:hypothetical protein
METTNVMAPEALPKATIKKAPRANKIQLKSVVMATEVAEPKEALESMKKTATKIDKIKVKDQKSAARKLQAILALWVAAVRTYADHMWKTYVARGGRAVGRFMKKIGRFILSLFNLNDSKKVDALLSKSRDVAKSAGQQALAAALMALLTSLADGARVAMSELIKDGGSKILQAIVDGAAEGFSESGTTVAHASPSSFGQQTVRPVSNNPFNNGYAQQNQQRYDPSVPPWART